MAANPGFCSYNNFAGAVSSICVVLVCTLLFVDLHNNVHTVTAYKQLAHRLMIVMYNLSRTVVWHTLENQMPMISHA